MTTIKILKEGLSAKCQLGEVVISDYTGDRYGCEHCRYVLPFSPMISDGGTWWCLNCIQSNDIKLTKQQIKSINDECLTREKEYIKKRYNQLFKK